MIGAGKYDDLCTYARITAGATGAVLVLVDGVDGSGFSVQGPEGWIRTLPKVLEDMAARIRADMNRGGH